MRNFQRVLQVIQDRLDQLDRQEATLQAELTVIEQEKDQIQGALSRVHLLSSGEHQLGPYDCLDCFVIHNLVHELQPIASESDYERFRCSNCGGEFESKP